MERYLMRNHPKVIQILCVDNCGLIQSFTVFDIEYLELFDSNSLIIQPLIMIIKPTTVKLNC